tara:strand:- start:168 stop:599 length:432 start_codon:yes stop_codon:yes gene_type:complete
MKMKTKTKYRPAKALPKQKVTIPVSVKREKMINKNQSKTCNSILSVSTALAQLEHMKTYPSKFLLPTERIRYDNYIDFAISELRKGTTVLRQFNDWLGDIDLQAVAEISELHDANNSRGDAVSKQAITQIVYRDSNGKFTHKS